MHPSKYEMYDPSSAIINVLSNCPVSLSLILKLTENFDFESIHPGLKMIVNCGLNQVRFPYPVKSGSKIRGRVKITNLIPKKNNIELVNEVSIEVEGRKRYGCVAETVLRLYY